MANSFVLVNYTKKQYIQPWLKLGEWKLNLWDRIAFFMIAGWPGTWSDGPCLLDLINWGSTEFSRIEETFQNVTEHAMSKFNEHYADEEYNSPPLKRTWR